MLSQLDIRLLLESELFKEKKKYWNDKLSGYTLSTRHKALDQSKFDCKKISLDPEIQEKLLKMCKGSDLSLYILLLSFLMISIYKFFNEEDIVIASPIYKGKSSIKTLNELVLIRSNVNETDRVIDFLALLKRIVIEAYNNQEYPINSLFGNEKDGETVFVDIACSLSTIHETFPSSFSSGIHVYFERNNHELSAYIKYSSRLYEDFVIDSFIQSFHYIISTITSNIHISLGELNFLPKEDEKKVLAFSQSSEKEFIKDHIINLFEEVVNKHPEQTAVWYEGKSISYSELDVKSDQVAYKLKEKGVSKGSVIGLYMERGIEAIVGMLGILKAGAAYLPLDPSLPINRIEYMISNSETKFVLTCGQELCLEDIEMIDLLDEQLYIPKKQKPEIILNSTDLAYVIYTSGSTGNPKGVMIEHKSVISLIKGLSQKIYSYYSKCRVAVVAPFYFDASVQQIFASLLLGHTLYIVPEQTRIDPLSLLDYYRENQIHISDGTPMHLQLFLNSPTSKFNDLSLQHLIIGGEVLSQKTVYHLLQKTGFNSLRITNVYGPTECCVDATAYEIHLEDVQQLKKHIPIGRPLKNHNIYILDRSLSLCPVGAVGEICISGAGVARGYMKLHKLNREKFIVNPFETGEKLYRTGDLGRWLPDGNIEYIGRKDNQIKLKGHRIELGEIEKSLLKHPNVTAVAVICHKIDNQDELIAYYISDVTLGTDQCREFLATILPDYMIPRYYMKIEKFPLTRNGKVDRNQLPIPKEPLRDNKEYEPPTSKLEISIAMIWSKILGSIDIGLHDNFFILGGDSLKALRIVLELEKIGLKVKLHDIFKYQTIKSLAEYIHENMKQNLELVDSSTSEQLIYAKYNIKTKVSTYEIDGKEYSVWHVDDEQIDQLLVKLQDLRGLIPFPHYVRPLSQTFEVKRVNKAQVEEIKRELLLSVREENRALHSLLSQNNIINYFPLTPIQKGFLEAQQEYSGAVIHIASDLDYEHVQQAINNLIRQQSLLRSVLTLKENQLYWQEYALEKDLTVPFSDLSIYSPQEQKEILDMIIPEMLYEPYSENSFLYRMLLIKLNMKEYKLIFPCHHAIFDGMSAEVIEKELELNLQNADYNNMSLIDHIHYNNYQLQIEKGPSLPAKEIIQSLHLDTYDYYSRLLYKNITLNLDNQSYRYVVHIPFSHEHVENLVDVAWEATIFAIKEFSSEYFNTTYLPILLLHYGRRYQDKVFFNTVGNFIDLVPILLDGNISDSSSYVRNQIKMVSDYNINFAAIVYDERMRKRYQEVFNTIDPTVRMSFLLNFHGKGKQEKLQLFNSFNEKKQLDLSVKNKLFIRNGITFDVLYTDDILRLSISCPFKMDEQKFKNNLEAYVSYLIG